MGPVASMASAMVFAKGVDHFRGGIVGGAPVSEADVLLHLCWYALVSAQKGGNGLARDPSL